MSAYDEPFVLSDDEIATLNAARRILVAASNRTPHTERGGKCYMALEHAEHGIFQALNWLNATDMRPVSEAQLHLREEVSA